MRKPYSLASRKKGASGRKKIVEEMHERKWKAFEDDKAELFWSGKKAGPMEKIGL